MPLSCKGEYVFSVFNYSRKIIITTRRGHSIIFQKKEKVRNKSVACHLGPPTMNLDTKVWRAVDFRINLSISGIYYIAVIIIK